MVATERSAAMAQSPFPGMDPYLELPELWPDVHNRLMNLFAEQLGDLLAPKYIAELDTQIVIDSFGDLPPEIESALPDVTITQPRMIRESSAESTTVAHRCACGCLNQCRRAW
jgi:hypothetical protein